MAMTRKFVEVKSKYEHIQNWYEYNIFSIKCRQIYIFITFNSLILVLLFTKQFFTFHSKLNIVKCDKLILPTMDLNSQPTSCISGKRLPARPQGPHGKERTTPRLIL